MQIIFWIGGIALIFVSILATVTFIKSREKLTDQEKDLTLLLSILFRVVAANKGVPAEADDRILDAEGLALKFFGHSLSVLYLYRGITLPDLSSHIKDFPDPPSLNVVARAAFEAYLVFYYIYIDAKNEDEEDLRYHAWELSGLYERQTFPATTAENVAKLREEKELIRKIELKLDANPIYKAFSDKEKKTFFKKLKMSNWRTKGWVEIARSAGFSNANSKTTYRFLCEHAHSGNISVTQVRQFEDFSSRKELMGAAIGHLLICVANMIKHYGEYFDKSKVYYNTYYQEPNTVSLWIDIGQSEGETETNA